MKKRIRNTLLVLCAVMLLGAAVCLSVREHIARDVQSVRQAERWAGESGMDFIQLSCFFCRQEETSLEQIYTLRQKLNESFTAEGLKAGDGGELVCDTWSAMGKLRVSSDRADIDAEALGIGGSFFDFHPMELLSGSYLRPDALSRDQVVLDELLAWLLFGGSNVAGMQVEIGGLPYEVVGVVRQDDSKAVQQFRSASPTVYLPYETFQSMNRAGISCYEIVLPEPVSGYGESIVAENFSVGNGMMEIITGRLRLSGSWELLKSFPMRGTQTKAVALPYWENAVRYEENRCALWLLAALWLLTVPSICAFFVLIWLWLKARKAVIRYGPRAVRGIGNFFYRISAWLTRRRKRY